MSEILRLLRSTKNKFAAINHIPGTILSLIPRCWERQDPNFDKNLITLTHVCRSWRALFISYPSLWNRLDFTNVEKTLAYIKRSRLLPLEAVLCKFKWRPYLEDAFLLAAPHFRRFQFLTFVGTSDFLRSLTNHLTPTSFILKELTIDLADSPALSPSVHALMRGGAQVTPLPWNNLPNLTTFKLTCAPDSTIAVAQLLNFFESAPHLTDITLIHSIPTISNAPSGRVVYLSQLKNLTISADTVHSTLLNHLSIPEGALLALDFNFNGEESPLPHYLPKTIKHLKNLFRVTTVNLHFNETMKFVRLDGPSGGLYISGHREDWEKVAAPLDLDRRILQSLDYFSLHMTLRLAIMKYEPPTPTKVNESSPYKFLLRMADLRSLILTQCNNLPFILALNPTHDPTAILCPRLEELTLYIEKRDAFHVPELVSMVKERALRGAKLQSVAIVGLGELVSGKEVFKLRDHVAHVEYRFEDQPPKWDSVPGGENS